MNQLESRVTKVRMDRFAGGTSHLGVAPVGPNDNPAGVNFKATGFNFGTPTPTVVLCQPRQGDNNDNGWPDLFAVQVIETGRDFVRFLVRRIDQTGGWGQDLKVDMLIIE